MTLIQNFAVNVRQYRRVGGLTQAQLAEALGLSVEMVGKIERGTSSPSFETIEKLSDVLKVPTAVLFGANADSLPKGLRGDLLNEIHGHLANLNDGDLKRAEAMIRAFAR